MAGVYKKGVKYIQLPEPVMQCNKMGVKEKLVFSSAVNQWSSPKPLRTSDIRLCNLSGLSIEDVKAARNSLVERGLISISGPTTNRLGILTGRYIIETAKANKFFECELFDVEKEEKKMMEDIYTKTGLKVLDNPYYNNKKEEKK